MSQIKINRLENNEVEVRIDGDVPLEMVEQLTKSLHSKGMIEDKSRSSLSRRYFVVADLSGNIADTLIKNLENMTGLSKGPGDVTQGASGRRNIPGLVGWSMDPQTGSLHHSINGVISTTPHSEGGFNVVHGGKAFARVPNMNSAGQAIRQYVNTLGPSDTGMVNGPGVDKSDYGPKRYGQYNPADNARRKSNNVSTGPERVPGAGGPNATVKAVSTKPGQLSGKAQAALMEARKRKLSGPVKQWSKEQIQTENQKRMEKAWADHLPFPNADEEIRKMPPVVRNEDQMANDLRDLLLNKNILGVTPPPQPTDKEMFRHLEVTEEMAKAAEHQWGNVMNNWLQEATKPISQRFNSEEEELAYWDSIKVADRDKGESGY